LTFGEVSNCLSSLSDVGSDLAPEVGNYGDFVRDLLVV
jgi:hypothetical protein